MSSDLIHRLSVQSDRVERVLVRIVRLIAVTLLVAVALVPVAQVVPDDGDDPVEHVTARELLTIVSQPTERFLRDDDESVADSAHPIAIPGGLLLIRVGLVLLVLGGLATAFSAVLLLTSSSRRDAIVLRVSAATLLAAAVLLALGLGWLPTYREDEIGPAWGVWIPALAAIWVLATRIPTEPED